MQSFNLPLISSDIGSPTDVYKNQVGVSIDSTVCSHTRLSNNVTRDIWYVVVSS